VLEEKHGAAVKKKTGAGSSSESLGTIDTKKEDTR